MTRSHPQGGVLLLRLVRATGFRLSSFYVWLVRSGTPHHLTFMIDSSLCSRPHWQSVSVFSSVSERERERERERDSERLRERKNVPVCHEEDSLPSRAVVRSAFRSCNSSLCWPNQGSAGSLFIRRPVMACAGSPANNLSS